MEEVNIRLSARAAQLLREAAAAGKVPAWQVVERAILAALGDAPAPGSRPFPAEALAIAAEVASFLDAAEDRGAAVRALHRSWKQTLLLARQEMERRAALVEDLPS